MDTSELNKRLFKSIDVWKRASEKKLVRYRCFELLPNRGFCVQSADFYALPVNEAQVRSLDKQFVELLLEDAPDARTKLYAQLEEAIEAHEKEFEGM